MKRLIACILAATMVMVMGTTPARAIEADDVGVYVIYTSRKDNLIKLENEAEAKVSSSTYASSRVHDLSESNLPYNFTLAADESDQTELFRTNTTKAYVLVDPYDDCYLKVEILDSNGTSLAERTLSIKLSDERTPTVTFTNLTASKNYKVRITNYSQKEVLVGGGIRDSFFW